MKKTRDWIKTAKDEGQANTDRHEQEWKENWTIRFGDCCSAIDPCQDHVEQYRRRIPCEGCSIPIVLADDYEWEHVLCSACEDKKPADFLEYVKARVLCMGEIASLKSSLKLAKERERYWQGVAASLRGGGDA